MSSSQDHWHLKFTGFTHILIKANPRKNVVKPNLAIPPTVSLNYESKLFRDSLKLHKNVNKISSAG